MKINVGDIVQIGTDDHWDKAIIEITWIGHRAGKIRRECEGKVISILPKGAEAHYLAFMENEIIGKITPEGKDLGA